MGISIPVLIVRLPIFRCLVHSAFKLIFKLPELMGPTIPRFELLYRLVGIMLTPVHIGPPVVIFQRGSCGLCDPPFVLPGLDGGLHRMRGCMSL